MSQLLLIAQFTVGTVFLLSVASKLTHHRAFARAIEDYEIVPEPMALSLSVSIILIETWLGVTHFAGWWLRVAAPLGIGVFITFAVAVAINLRRGRVLPCYCFDASGGEPISDRTLLRLVLLIFIEAFLMANPSQLSTYSAVSAGTLYLADLAWYFFCAMLLLVAFSWLLSLPEVAELLR